MRLFCGFALTLLMTSMCREQETDDTNPSTDSDSDTDADSDSETDSGSDIPEDSGPPEDAGWDTDSVTDTNSDPNHDCEATPGNTDWGQPCSVLVNACTGDSWCMQIDSIHATRGFCTVECCQYNTVDPDYCTDISKGTEFCGIVIDYADPGPRYFCLIYCENDEECPTGLTCSGVYEDGKKICYRPL